LPPNCVITLFTLLDVQFLRRFRHHHSLLAGHYTSEASRNPTQVDGNLRRNVMQALMSGGGPSQSSIPQRALQPVQSSNFSGCAKSAAHLNVTPGTRATHRVGRTTIALALVTSHSALATALKIRLYGCRCAGQRTNHSSLSTSHCFQGMRIRATGEG
jgi:hypothetical protein